MAEPEPIRIVSGRADGERVELPLWRLRREGGRPVLLLHGASARHESFMIPGPHPQDPGSPRCLMEYLHGLGFEPWLLDWRGSGLVVDEVLNSGTAGRLRDCFDFDCAARFDVPAALDAIARERASKGARGEKAPVQIGAVGHCMGAAILAQAIAAGHAGPEQGLRRVVLLTLGLFYEPAWDGRLKGQDHVLERLRHGAPMHLVVDPRPGRVWPPELEEIYANWPDSLRPHRDGELSETERMCNRVSFMYGPPYLERNLDPSIHRDGLLEGQFGAIPLRMYLHGAQNARRGWAAPFDAENDDVTLIGPDAWRRFDVLDSVTLLTGAENQLWHRDSIDRMYEWLMRGSRSRHCAVRKQVFTDYGHQDLLWGSQAHAMVFGEIAAGLGEPALEAETAAPPRRAPPPPAPGPVHGEPIRLR